MNETPAPINPSEEPYFGSKSMILLLLSTGTLLALLLIYVAVKVIFHEDITQVILGAMGMESAKTGVGIARNTIVDGQARQAYNAPPSPPQPPIGGQHI